LVLGIWDFELAKNSFEFSAYGFNNLTN
jgi:hypothetical protein